ncbi:hypothetical protein [Flocculibacter collagenilyticus]|uniref:hypothetical protein n=1 Tax=Flocculibacter collagenilyticus TaxID=2744479 RepID=UPI0018F64A2E|nr:hypothetical protein [Flocculibacter collagenilyticus]
MTRLIFSIVFYFFASFFVVAHSEWGTLSTELKCPEGEGGTSIEVVIHNNFNDPIEIRESDLGLNKELRYGLVSVIPYDLLYKHATIDITESPKWLRMPINGPDKTVTIAPWQTLRYTLNLDKHFKLSSNKEYIVYFLSPRIPNFSGYFPETFTIYTNQLHFGAKKCEFFSAEQYVDVIEKQTKALNKFNKN